MNDALSFSKDTTFFAVIQCWLNVYIECKYQATTRRKWMLSQRGLEKFEFLRKMALKMGAADARIITADKVVVEDRIVLKCKVGCTNYGTTLACPPHIPTAEEFRKIVSEYRYALFMKFKSQAKADSKIAKYLSKDKNDPSIPENMKDKIQAFWATWKEEKLKMLSAVLDLEKAAMSKGYPLAIGLVSGYCQLCEKCTLDRAVCVHPTEARYSEEGVGVNVQATAKNAGIKFTFPFEKTPESFALLLID
jgi:predicted metal-binding protein